MDPKPSADRIVPSPIHSAFECPQRNRAAISGDNGRVSLFLSVCGPCTTIT